MEKHLANNDVDRMRVPYYDDLGEGKFWYFYVENVYRSTFETKMATNFIVKPASEAETRVETDTEDAQNTASKSPDFIHRAADAMRERFGVEFSKKWNLVMIPDSESIAPWEKPQSDVAGDDGE